MTVRVADILRNADVSMPMTGLYQNGPRPALHCETHVSTTTRRGQDYSETDYSSLWTKMLKLGQF